MGIHNYEARIYKTPEYKTTKNGKGFLVLNLVENHRERLQSGEWQDSKTPTWHNGVTIWNGQDGFADELAANPDVNKGALVEVSVRQETVPFLKDGQPVKDEEGRDRTTIRETVNSLKVKFPPKEPQPAVRPADDGFTPQDDGQAF